METIVNIPPTDKFKENFGKYPGQGSQGEKYFSEGIDIEFLEPDPLPRIVAQYERIMNAIHAKKMMLETKRVRNHKISTI